MGTLSAKKMSEYVPRARKLLVTQARTGHTVPYSTIQNRLGGRGYVGQVLDTLNVEEHEAKRPLLSALVVNLRPGGMPSRGFFLLVRRLKPNTRGVADRQVWEAERDAVFAFGYPD
jgi:hypothetical protein